MSEIPPEIKEFFNSFPGQTFLVKGRPGTGKSIFALEILREFSERGNGLYISTRMEPRRLYAISPWIREFIPERNVIDATQRKLRRSLKLESERRIKTFDYGTVLEFFKAIYEDAEEMENPMIIFDSWDGVISHLNLDGEAASLTQSICDFCRDLETHVVFVAEREEQTYVDFIVDGVVTLRKYWIAGSPVEEDVKNCMVREIEINKLRGIYIKQPKYLFTLKDGRFRSFSPFMEKIPSTIKPTKDMDEQHLTSGIRDLDEILGWLSPGSFNLWEVGHGVNKRYDQMLFQACMNVIANGGGVVGIPPMGSSIITRRMDNLVIYQPETDDVNIETSSFLGVARQIRERTGRPIMSFISIDTLENIFGLSNSLKFLENVFSISRETGMLSFLIYIMRSESPLSRFITQAVDTHITFMDVDGALAIRPIRPPKGLYGITSDEEGVRLIPIV